MQNKEVILIVEDDYEIRHMVELLLDKNGFVAVSCDSAEKALKKVSSLKPSLILMDIQLPKMDGLECCKKMRQVPWGQNIPIIFFSAHSSDTYKITGLESGADDFITKPFSPGELLARVKAVLRRTQKTKRSSNFLVQDSLVSINLRTRKAKVRGKEIHLTPKEFALLLLFLKSEREVLSRDVLFSRVWECENLTTSRTLDMHIARLRKKLGRHSKSIQTVGKMGYRYLGS